MVREKEVIGPADLSRVRQDSLSKRRNLVSMEEFARLMSPGEPAGSILSSLPDILGGRSLKELVNRILQSRRSGALVGAALGAHIVKCGVTPVIIDLMEKGFIRAISLNGAGAVHDFEVAFCGATSEDVAEGLKEGTYGMVRETFEFLNRAAEEGARNDTGFGAALGKRIEQKTLPHRGFSLLAAAHRLGIPATVHVAVGTDIVHMHPGLNAEALGRATHTDFRILVSVVSRLEGGVWMNLGSAVVLPEVFLKALNVARNLGFKVERFFAANLDMIQHYRPKVNVVERPSGEGVCITGHHEILLPILRLALLGGETGKEGGVK